MKTNPDLQVREDFNGEALASLRLELAIREMVGFACHGDIYRMIARRVAVKVAERAKDMSAKFPNIVVQST